MQSLSVLSFFFPNNIEAPWGELLRRTISVSSNSCSWIFNSSNSVDTILNGDWDFGEVYDSMLIDTSTPLEIHLKTLLIWGDLITQHHFFTSLSLKFSKPYIILSSLSCHRWNYTIQYDISLPSKRVNTFAKQFIWVRYIPN